MEEEDEASVFGKVWEMLIELTPMGEEDIESRLPVPENAEVTLGSIKTLSQGWSSTPVLFKNSPHDTSRIIQRTI
jgi:hypothetical protein